MTGNIQDSFEGEINSGYWDLARIKKERLSLVNIGSVFACKITVAKGDLVQIGNDGKKTERSEISERLSCFVPVNTYIKYSFDVYFPKDFLIVENRLVFAQWKQNTGRSESPFLSLRYQNGILIGQMINTRDRMKHKKKIDIRGKWTTFAIEYRLERELEGFVKIYMKNKLFVDYKGELGFPFPREHTYFKMGLYRDQIDVVQSIYFSSFKREYM